LKLPPAYRAIICVLISILLICARTALAWRRSTGRSLRGGSPLQSALRAKRGRRHDQAARTLSYQLTLTRVAGAIGWDRCAAICGVSERAVRLWSDHDCETEIRMIDAERLDRAFMDHGGDHAPFHRLMALRLEIAAARQKPGALPKSPQAPPRKPARPSQR
jgi:hypothetical protein